MTRDEARALDAADPLRAFRDRFVLSEDRIYLDGNSLGALPRSTPARIADLVERQWGEDLIAGWNRHGWIDAPYWSAERLGALVGAAPGQLIAADSTSVCLFKLLGAAIAARPGRRHVLTQTGNFPTDSYVAHGLARMLGNIAVKAVKPDEIVDAIDEDTIAVYLTHVDYRGGGKHDMAAINAAAREAGAINLWDLSHSAGAMVLDLDGWGCDLAVGCGYKYLNGGPGAPAFIYVAERLQQELEPPILGWMGHSDPFDFAADYRPAAGIARFLTGTPSILGLAALDCGLATFDGATMADVEAKSQRLTGLFIDMVEERCGDRLTLIGPRDPAERGSHVTFAHPDGFAIVQALIADGITGDFRPPDGIRFGFAPLYTRFEEVWQAAERLGALIDSGSFANERFRARGRVT